ncbi:unnamed protein product, partial [Vitis vinifera]|uniref:Uncharacterized protein n=1 Tax=Vitis vinifera TaxID=29760 RepID=E0CTV5_VITVI
MNIQRIILFILIRKKKKKKKNLAPQKGLQRFSKFSNRIELFLLLKTEPI